MTAGQWASDRVLGRIDPQPSAAQQTFDEQIAILFRRSSVTTAVGVPFALMLAWAIHAYVDPAAVWLWFALRCAITGGRAWLQWAYRRSDRRDTKRWRNRFVWMLAVDGFLWGLAGTWLVPVARPDIVALLLTVLVGVSAIAAFVLQASLRASLAFILPMMLPAAVFQFFAPTSVGIYFGVGLLGFVFLLARESADAQARIAEMLQLRFSTDRIANERSAALLLAERESAAKDQFLATMSHEMRTPLHGILGLARLLLRNDAPPSRAHLELMERSGEHLLGLINDVLDVSKMGAGQVTLANEVFDLAALVTEAAAMPAINAAQAGLALTTALQMPQPCWVSGDPQRLRQVLQNLLGNAIKFTAAGSIHVDARHDAVSGSTCIAVRDTGIGIAADDVERIFTAFAQADSSFSRRFSGTGLGLTISRELVRAMGGDVVCRSTPGEGSCFTATLNLPTAAALPVQASASAAPLQLVGHVLLAEDNAVNALVACAVMERLGLSVEVVGNGELALAAFRRRTPDLVLMDCHMPVMDGFQATRRMREIERIEGRPRTAVIALTANALAGDRERSLECGMDDHLAKPFRDDDLVEMLQRFVRAPTSLPLLRE